MWEFMCSLCSQCSIKRASPEDGDKPGVWNLDGETTLRMTARSLSEENEVPGKVAAENPRKEPPSQSTSLTRADTATSFSQRNASNRDRRDSQVDGSLFGRFGQVLGFSGLQSEAAPVTGSWRAYGEEVTGSMLRDAY
mmetsp:Transcript_2688/g.4182  ORF Transcript_2688/g.4182 Transcript_2688/m.4182 type:complete len:138 (-) Transcript_2688:286-699(-)